jgi:hypothetical protein|tara:strand:+ start:396 stop:632 length:237 start_codon:yes stop_codon:yes gene_type:complete
MVRDIDGQFIPSEVRESWVLQAKDHEAMTNINRLEVIDQTGRAYVHYMEGNEILRYSLQDDNRTLKMFIETSERGTAE